VLLKNSLMRTAVHFIDHGWCDEVTHIARSVPFDYWPKSAQRDSIEGKHSFRVFNPFLTGSRPDVRSCRLESHRAKGIPVQLPSILQGDSLTRLLQGAAAGAVATLVIGFNWGGWVTGGTAKEMTQKSVSFALVSALSPICVDKFRHSVDSAANLAERKKVNSWQQGSFIEKGGWATMPGSEVANSGVAESCATTLGSLDK
jgi:hypothetical protein